MAETCIVTVVLLGLFLPIPNFAASLIQWRRFVSSKLNINNKARLITLASLIAASIALACWILRLTCVFWHGFLPFEVCRPNFAAMFCTIFSLIANVTAALGTRHCRWPTVISAIGMLLYSFSLGSIVR